MADQKEREVNSRSTAEEVLKGVDVKGKTIVLIIVIRMIAKEGFVFEDLQQKKDPSKYDTWKAYGPKLW